MRSFRQLMLFFKCIFLFIYSSFSCAWFVSVLPTPSQLFLIQTSTPIILLSVLRSFCFRFKWAFELARRQSTPLSRGLWKDSHVGCSKRNKPLFFSSILCSAAILRRENLSCCTGYGWIVTRPWPFQVGKKVQRGETENLNSRLFCWNAPNDDKPRYIQVDNKLFFTPLI